MKMDSALLTSHKSGKKTETLEWSSVSQQLSDDGKIHIHIWLQTLSLQWSLLSILEPLIKYCMRVFFCILN